MFIDTNYFLRFLLTDVPTQTKEAKELFSAGARGDVKLFTSLIVMFELYWVLHSFYKKTKSELVEILTDIIKMRFIIFEERIIFQKTLRAFSETNFDLEDAYNLTFAQERNATQFKTFDKKLAAAFKRKI